MDPDTNTPDPNRARGSGAVGAAIGGALVVAIMGGVVGGVLASSPRVASPSPGPSVVDVTPVPAADPTPQLPEPSPEPSEEAVPQASPEPTSGAQTTAPSASPSAAPVTTASAAPSASGRPASRPASRVDPGWLAQVAARTGVPPRALEAYAAATLTLQREKAACSLGWNTLAAIGQIESRHGSYGGATLGDDGVVAPRIIGPALDGKGFASIPDTDGGQLDGDTTWDRAVGPMQFIPSTWKLHGADGNGDGVKDPHNIDDAALAAARYLCAHGGMDSAGGWRSAVFGYNRSEDYLAQVARIANDFAHKVGG